MLIAPSPFRLRSMRLSDIPEVMDIERRAFPTPWKASGYRYEVSRNPRARYRVLLVQEDQQPPELIGYSGFWTLAGEAHISTLAVATGWRGIGLGELLLLDLLERALGESLRLVTLEVRTSNAVAQALYRKLRFEVVGVRPRYYQGKEDALIMTVEPLDQAYAAFLQTKMEELFARLQQRQTLAG